eukprot:Partr_v1_DN27322_c0_g1_i2_m46417 putative Rna-binding protein
MHCNQLVAAATPPDVNQAQSHPEMIVRRTVKNYPASSLGEINSQNMSHREGVAAYRPPAHQSRKQEPRDHTYSWELSHVALQQSLIEQFAVASISDRNDPVVYSNCNSRSRQSPITSPSIAPISPPSRPLTALTMPAALSPSLYPDSSVYSNSAHSSPGMSPWGPSLALSMPALPPPALNHTASKSHVKYQKPFQPLPQPSKSPVTKGSRKSQIQSEAMVRFRGMKLGDFNGKMASTAKDQYGCRYLQSLIDEDPKLVSKVLNDIRHDMCQLITDPFGNYLCQKLIEMSDDSNFARLISIISPRLVEISKNVHGTRAVQKLIENSRTVQHMQAIEASFSNRVTELTCDLNGNHVIQKCLMRFGSKVNQFIFDAVSKDCVEIATHRHGCCVFQRCIDFADEQQKNTVISVIVENALDLVQDPFGNYVVQYVLDLNNQMYTRQMISMFVGSAYRLSIQKFSSNVIEKSIKAETKYRHSLISELVVPSVMDRLVRDPFGNYVVQTALEYADPLQQVEIILLLAPLVDQIKHSPNGKRLLGKLTQYQHEIVQDQKYDEPRFNLHMQHVMQNQL